MIENDAGPISRIWVLFFDPNEYDAHANVMLGWWDYEPSMRELADAIGVKFPSLADDETLTVAKVHMRQKVRWGGGDYRLEYIPRGKYRQKPEAPAEGKPGKKLPKRKDKHK